MNFKEEFSLFPSSKYTGVKVVEDLDRHGLVDYRNFMFDEFLRDRPARLEAFMGLEDDDQRFLVYNQFQNHVTQSHPDLFSIKVKDEGVRKQPVRAFGSTPAGPAFAGSEIETRTPAVRSALRDAGSERAYDLVLSGDLTPDDFDHEDSVPELVMIRDLLEERNEIGLAKSFHKRIEEHAKSKGIEMSKWDRFLEGAVKSPVRQAISNMAGVGGADIGIQEVVDPEEFHNAVKELSLEEPSEDRLLRLAAYPESEGWEMAGAMAGILGSTVGGALGISRTGGASMFRRIAGTRKFAIDKRAMGQWAALDFTVGAAYDQHAPGIVSELLDVDDAVSPLLTGLEVMFLSSVIGAGVDFIRGAKGANPARLSKVISENLTDEQKLRFSKAGVDLDNKLRTVDEVTEDISSINNPVERTLSDAEHSLVSYEGYVGRLAEDGDGNVLVRTSEGVDVEVSGSAKDWGKTLNELGVTEVDPYNPRSVVVSDDRVRIGDAEYMRPGDLSDALNRDPDGNIVSITMKNLSGEDRTIRTPVEVEQIADILLDRAIAQSDESLGAVRAFASSKTGTRAVRARDFLEKTAKRVNPTTRMVTEALDIGESVLPDGRLVGGADDYVRQYADVFTTKNIRIAKTNIHNIIDSVRSNKDIRASRKTKLIRELEHKIGALELYEQGKLFKAGIRTTGPDTPSGLEAIREIGSDLTPEGLDAIQRGNVAGAKVVDLRKVARVLDIKGSSQMRKDDLVSAIEDILTSPAREVDASIPLRDFDIAPDPTPTAPRSLPEPESLGRERIVSEPESAPASPRAPGAARTVAARSDDPVPQLNARAQQEKEIVGTREVTNSDGRPGGRVVGDRPSTEAVLSGDPVVLRTSQSYARTLDQSLGIVGVPQAVVEEWVRKGSNWLLRRGSMPKLVWEEMFRGAGRIKEVRTYARLISRDLERGIKSARRAGEGSDSELRSMVRRAMTGTLDMDSLPQVLRDPAKRARKLLSDNAHKAVVERVVTGEMAGTFMDTSERWMTRAYRMFFDPDWAKNIPDDVFNDAVDWIKVNWRDYQLDKSLAKRMEKWNKAVERWEVDHEKALSKGKTPPKMPKMPTRKEDYIPPAMTDEEARLIARELIDPQDFNGFWNPGAGLSGKVGGKEIGVLMRRKDVPLAIRRLMGEVDDPVEAFILSSERQANLIENHITQRNIREFGLETGVLSRNKSLTHRAHMGSKEPSAAQSAATARQDEVAETMLGEGDAIFRQTGRFDVWDGIYARDDFYNDMMAYAKFNAPLKNEFSRWFTRGIAGVKFAKTILNYPSGHITNAFGAFNNMVQAGHVNPVTMVKGIQTILRNEYGGSAGLDSLIGKLTKHNLLNQSVVVRDMTRSLEWMRSTSVLNSSDPRRILREMIRQWRAPDDMVKAISWMDNENQMIRAGLRELMSPDAFENEVARRVGLTQQMYDRVPTLLKRLSRYESGVVNFVSFSYDQLRVGVNNLILVAQDVAWASKLMSEGHTKQAIGLGRMASRRLAAYTAWGIGAGEAARRLLNSRSGVEDDDVEHLLPWVAPFFREETIGFTKNPRETGIVSPQILSYNLPNENHLKIVRSGFRAYQNGENPADAVWNGVRDMYFGKGIMTAKLAESVSGYDSFGRRIPGGLIGRTGHAISAFEPGLNVRLGNIAKTMSGEERRFGRADTVEDVIAYFAGQRRYPVNVEKAVPDQFRFTWMAYTNAERDFESVVRRNVTGIKLRNEYRNAELTRRQNFDHMKSMVKSLEEYFGYSRGQVDSWLREHARMGRREIINLRMDRYVPLEMRTEQ